MPRTTVIHTHGGGRFGNQLLLFAHLIALAATHEDLEVIHVPFWPYAELCEGTSANPLCLYPPAPPRYGWARPVPGLTRVIAQRLPGWIERSLGYRLPPLLHRAFRGRSIDLNYAPSTTDINAPEFVARLRASRWTLLAGYDLRGWDAFDAQTDRIRAFLRPVPRFWKTADGFLTDLRQRHDPLVAVHIRRTDYRVWNGGMFFFADPQYLEWIAQIRARCGVRTGFVLSADEPVDRSPFDPSFCYWSEGTAGGSGHYLDAMATLAGCDLIAAVPSTFAAWTAFFGGRPLLPLGPGVDAASEPWLERVWSEGRQHPLMSMTIR